MSTTLEPKNHAASRPLRVLIVDDNEPDVVTISRMLRKQFGSGVEIRESDNAADGLALLREQSFDVALIDYLLPDMDGLEILAEIAAIGSRTAAILLSGQGSETVAAQAIKRGAKDYLVKRDLSSAALEKVVIDALASQVRDGQESPVVEQLRRDHWQLDHCVRSLSHDMSATFMVLENSFERLRTSAGENRISELVEGMSHVEACLRESKRFLDDLRVLAKTGNMGMEESRVELSRAVGEVLYELADVLRERNVQVDVEPNLPAVWCHETRAKQIISNLVRNAVRHGCDAAQPRITIGICPPDSASRSNDFVWLRIHDNGTGIPPESCDEIFLPGRRLKASVPGTGMGLAIVKKIVDHYGGTVFVDPLCRSGTAFVVSLPAAGAGLEK